MGNMNYSFWEGKKVLITGHTGFKGMWLSIYLANLGAEILGLSDQASEEKRLYKSIKKSQVFSSESFVDIRSSEETKNFIVKENPEIIFHLAAQPLVRASYHEPTETFETNIMGTINVLNAVRYASNANKVICVTSDKCYRNVEQYWGYRENDPLGGEDPYSASKGASEIVAYSMWSSFLKEKGVSMATVRAGNVIGGGDYSKDRIMTDIVNANQQKQNLVIRNPFATRPWQHVLEPIHAYSTVVTEKLTNEAEAYYTYNIGPDSINVKSVGDLVTEVSKTWDFPVVFKQNDENSFHEATLLSLDNAKIKHETSWKPIWNFEATIKKSLNWYEDFNNGACALELCEADIADYIIEGQTKC